MQESIVNEVVANNSTYTPAQMVRITADNYAKMAEHICSHIKSYPTTICGSFDNLEFEFHGMGFFGEIPNYPHEVANTWVECRTYDDDIEEVRNNFRIDTLMAYIEEEIRMAEAEKYYPEFS